MMGSVLKRESGRAKGGDRILAGPLGSVCYCCSFGKDGSG
jgi:hypothetical protein